MTKKKILFKIWKFPRLSETFITAQIITAINCGYEVSILVKDLLDFEDSKQQKLLHKYAIREKIILENFKIPKNKIFRFLHILKIFPTILANFKSFYNFLMDQDSLSLSDFYRFRFYCKLKGFDIVHVQYGTSAKPFDLLKKIGLYKAKLIVSFHGHDVFFPINGWIENNGYYEDLFKYGDFMIANTPYLAEQIEALGCPRNKIKIIPVGVDAQFFKRTFQKKLSTRSFKLISVGRLDEVKGHRYGIEAVKLLKDKGLDIHYTIVGEGHERKALENQIARLALKQEVELVGKKSQKEVKEYLLCCDLYILPAVAVHNLRRETQGLATLEAKACGLPVVVFDSGGVKYTLINEQTGFVVPEYDIKAMAEKVGFFIKNPPQLEKMGQNARNFIENFYSQEKIDRRWSYFYDKLISCTALFF